MSEIERLRAQLKGLCLHMMADILEEEAMTAAKSGMSYTAFLTHLADEEIAAKTDRSINDHIGKAKFPMPRTLEEFDFAFQPSLSAARVKELAELRFPQEVAKSHGERRVPSQVLLVLDTIDLDPGSGGRLVYSPERHQVVPGPGMLQGFVGLWAVPASKRGEKVLAFARRWGGGLALCEHDLPHTHEPGCYPRGWWDYPDRRLWESISAWEHFSRAAFGIFNIAHGLHQEPLAVGAPADCAAVFARSGRATSWWQRRVDVERVILGRVINKWLSLGNVRPSFQWPASDREPSVKLAGPGLFGFIAVQLAYAAAADGLEICSACGAAYFPKTRPRQGEQHYCPSCGTKAAKRHVQAAWRARQRGRMEDGGAQGQQRGINHAAIRRSLAG